MEKRGPVDVVLALVAWALIGFGVATWAVALTIFEPALAALVDPNGFAQHVKADDTDSLSAYLVRLPWMSILLGVAGALLMLRRSRLRGWLGWGLLLGWLVADIVLGRLNVAGPVAAVVAGTVAAVVVVGVVIVGAMRSGPPIDRPFATVYSGVLLVAIFLVAPSSDSSYVAHYPAALVGMAKAVAVALALAVVVTAMSASATVSTRHAVVVSAVIATIVVVGILVHRGVFGDSLARARPTSLGTIVVIGAVPVVLALLAGGVTHRLLPTFALLAGLSPVFGVVVLALVYMGPFGTTVIAGYIGADSDALVDWALMVTLLFVGALFGAAALVPQLVRRSRPQPVLLGAAPVLE